MIKRMIIILVLVGAVLAGVFGFKIFDDGQVKAFMASKGNLPQTVSATKAARSDWQPKLQAVGSLRASNGADLSLRLGGIVEEINFQSGDRVEKGQPLLRLRSDDDIAKLKALKAQVELARGRASRSARCSPCSSCRPSTSCSPRMIPRRA